MKWVTVWGNATSIAEHRPETYAKNITLRYPVRCAFGGEKIRLHFSNFCGTEPITLNRVTVASASSDREIDLKDAAIVTFNGSQSVTIPAGEELFSDEINFFVKPKGTISISFYLKDFTLMRSGVIITGPLSKGFFSVGDQTFTEVLPLDYTRTTSTFYFLTGVDVYTEDKNRAVICYGDSITSQSWPDYLAIACMEDPYNNTAIIRRAASGTRVLREYSCITYESYGLCGKHRFEREISTVSGADTVIIQQGINDIIHPVGTEVNPFRPMSDLPTVEELEEGIAYYLNLAKKYNLKSYLGTLLPIYGWRTYAPFREDMKNAFNEWIKTQTLSYGVIDFEGYLCDQDNICAFGPGCDSGDHLHPSEKAYKIMAKAAYEKLKE
ncbi:MAG: lipase [Clostridia bacterium]|nr:lipase [Clostridia bacterium]